MEAILANIAFVSFIAAALVQAVDLIKNNLKVSPVASALPIFGAVLLLISLVLRSFTIGFVALTSSYESLVFYSALIAIVAFIYKIQKKLPYKPVMVFGATMVIVVLLAVASSPLIPREALPPIPALRSAWLLLHVSFSFIGEAFFVLGFVASVLFLFSKNDAKLGEFDRIAYTAIATGYLFFTAGALAFGAIWAEQAWGRWWSWDPKETWALVTWLVYTAYLHLRLIAKKGGKLPAWLSVIGFLCTIFTFFGVNYLLPGLHSYG
ncbi:c-type cytochrome biogenesis protein CcsB [Spirochaetota bacterium]